LVLVDGAFLDVGQRAAALGEQVVVEALLELAGLAEPAGTSFSGHLVTYLAGAGTGGPGRRVECPGTGDGRPRQGSWTHHVAAESAGRVRNLHVCFCVHVVTRSEFPRPPGAGITRPAGPLLEPVL